MYYKCINPQPHRKFCSLFGIKWTTGKLPWADKGKRDVTKINSYRTSVWKKSVITVCHRLFLVQSELHVIDYRIRISNNVFPLTKHFRVFVYQCLRFCCLSSLKQLKGLKSQFHSCSERIRVFTGCTLKPHKDNFGHKNTWHIKSEAGLCSEHKKLQLAIAYIL